MAKVTMFNEAPIKKTSVRTLFGSAQNKESHTQYKHKYLFYIFEQLNGDHFKWINDLIRLKIYLLKMKRTKKHNNIDYIFKKKCSIVVVWLTSNHPVSEFLSKTIHTTFCVCWISDACNWFQLDAINTAAGWLADGCFGSFASVIYFICLFVPCRCFTSPWHVLHIDK